MSPDPLFEPSPEFAKTEDRRDPLRDFRSRVHHPIGHDGRPVVYFAGNSLGLQPIEAEEYVDEVIRAWQNMGVEGHFRGENPWLHYMERLVPPMADIVGAQSSEVTFMNALTLNIHLMLATFYRPTPKRFHVLMERDAFPSDRYAVRSHVQLRGYDPDEAIIWIEPRNGESLLRQEDIEALIRKRSQDLCLVYLGGLNYYTGQLLNLKAITKCARDAGCMVGFDLAHAAGNVPLQLHEWNVDFAVWCTYKYLNAGPGSPGGVFVHRQHTDAGLRPGLLGWWGQRDEARFSMRDDYRAAQGAAAFQISNPSILSFAVLRASLEQFSEAGFERMLQKSAHLTAYLEYLIRERIGDSVEILTPSLPGQRGAQLSIRVRGGRAVFDELTSRGVSCDWRDPEVIRMAPVPLYNSYTDVFLAVDKLRQALNA